MLTIRSKQLKSIMLNQSEEIKPIYQACQFWFETAP